MLFQYPYYSGTSSSLTGVFQLLQSWGFLDALMPFLLIFALIFAILQKIALFKEGAKADRKINGIIAFVIGMLIVVPHITRTYPPNMDPVSIISNILPGASILLIVILMVMILLGLAGAKIPNLVTWIVTVASLIILGIIILGASFPAWGPQWLFSDPNLIAAIVVLLVMGLIIWFITSEPEPNRTIGHSFEEFVDRWFKK